MANMSAVQILITLNGKTVTVKNNKKNVVSLKVSRVIGDTANKFTLELFDETAWKLESALYGTKNTPISIQYGATGEWKNGKYIALSGICTNYNLSFVGAATILSIEGVIYSTAGVSGEESANYWFKNETIQWVDTDVKIPVDANGVTKNIQDPEVRAQCSIDGLYYKGDSNSNTKGFDDVDSATGDYYDDVCARIEWIPPERNDGVNWFFRPIVNPTNIFKRIIRKYNGEKGKMYETTVLKDKVSTDADVRLMPTISSTVVDTIKKGTKIKVLEDLNTSVYIEYKSGNETKKGYIRRNTIGTKTVKTGLTGGTGKFVMDPKNVDESLWVDASSFGGSISQTSCTAADFITNTLCKMAVKPNAKNAGFNYFLKKGKHCFKAIDYSKSDTAKSIRAGYYVQDSNVISFSVNQIGAMVMAGAEIDPDTKEVLVDISAIDSLTGEIITSEGYFAEGYYNSEERMNEDNKSSSSNWETKKVVSASVVSSATKDILDTKWGSAFDTISNFTISASLTIWGEYNNTYIPGNYISVTVMTPDGKKHYSSGNYFILSADDNINADGYTTTLKLLKNTDRTKQTFNSDFKAKKVKAGTYAYGVDPYAGTTTTSIAGKETHYNAPNVVYTQQSSFNIDDYKQFMTKKKMTKAHQQFIVDVGALARKYWRPFHIYPSSLIAQAICESAWGTSKICKDKNNYFGIAAFDSSPYKSSKTFGSMEECVVAYYLRTFWSSTPGGSKKMGEYYTYKDVLKATNYSKQIKAIGYCGYATDTSYYKTLNSIINSYELYKWNDGLEEFTPDISKKGKYKWDDFWPPKS